MTRTQEAIATWRQPSTGPALDVREWRHALAAIDVDVFTFEHDVAGHALADAGLTVLLFDCGIEQLEFAVAAPSDGRVHVEVWCEPPLWFGARISDDVEHGARAVVRLRGVGLATIVRRVCARVEIVELGRS